MRLSDFEAMVRRMIADVPAEYLEGVAEVAVTRATVPHPTRAEVMTLGECDPLPAADGDGEVQSRILLHHGSFLALARLDPDFDWREEAWETLTHELRHHLEWRARTPDLEAFDAAAEANFARLDGESFDPLFFLDGESPAAGIYQVDHDVFLDQVVRTAPERVQFVWRGRQYQAPVPAGTRLPLFLRVTGVEDPPPGDLIVVLRRRAGIRDLFSRRAAQVTGVHAAPIPGEATL